MHMIVIFVMFIILMIIYIFDESIHYIFIIKLLR